MADDKSAAVSDSGSAERPSLRPTGSGLGGLASLRPTSRGSGSLSRLTAGRADNSGGPLLPQPREQKRDDAPRRPDVEVEVEEEDDSKDEEPEETHPLFQSWTFWFDKRSSQPNYAKAKMQAHYENNLKRVGEFEDVETFWQYFNNMQPASKIELNANYHLFRSGVKPMWEDPANAKGGKWTVHLKSGAARQNLDQYWKNVVLAMIGEMLDDHDDVMGAVMSRRGKADRISIWNRGRDSEAKIMNLGQKIKELIVTNLPGNHDLSMEYNGHDDSLRTGTSFSNPSKYKL